MARMTAEEKQKDRAKKIKALTEAAMGWLKIVEGQNNNEQA